MSRYFSVDDVLGEDERVPVRWLAPARDVGYLDPSSGGADVARGAAMDLPLWLAEELKARNLVEVSLPPHFSRKSRADITADAVAARLREKSPHFYSVGLRLAPLLSVAKEGEELSKDVHAALADRAAGILAHAKTTLGGDVSAYRGTLTDLEQSLFDAASAFTASKLAWRREEASFLRPPAAALAGLAGGGAGEGAASAEAALLAASTLPASRGTKRQRSLLTNSGL